MHIKIHEGRLHIKDQIGDYMDRGEALKDWLYLDFFLGTYDTPTLKDRTSLHGRLSNIHVPYVDGSDHPGRCRVVKSDDHETMSYFAGQWFPKEDLNKENGLFEASMLVLLKQWRTLKDIRGDHNMFCEAYNHFLSTARDQTLNTFENIKFFHETSESVRECGEDNWESLENIWNKIAVEDGDEEEILLLRDPEEDDTV